MFCALLTALKRLLLLLSVFYCAVFPASDCVTFTILATADLHGCTEQLQKAIAPEVAKRKSLDPDGVIYVDVGDAAQGTYLLNQNRGCGVMPLLYGSGCSIFVPGNHELEYGFEAFKSMVNEFPGAVLAANLQAPELADKVKPFVIVELNGVKVAFIGLMLKDMNNCFPVAETRFQTLPGRTVLRKAIQDARAVGADMIVLLRHAGKYGGRENLADLLKNMPEVDLVIGAHTHQGEAGCRIRRIWYVQPSSHGGSLLSVKVSFDLRKRQIMQMESSLEALPRFPEIVAVESLERVAPYGADPALAAAKMREFTKSDLALYAVDRARLEKLMLNDQPQMRDCYSCFSYFDPVITVQVTVGELHAIMREYLAFAHKRKQLLLTCGFAYRANRGKLHGLIMEKDQNVYTLAISAYAAAGAGGQLPDTRRILQGRIDHVQAEIAPGILPVITGKTARK